ncbi:hypothetical protein [Embleya sp. AB8]|uniref:hypothetical protein n=1 Tax=Embleya sp. AB8 TaxID=3156304 RepID=UPI003C70A091
MTTDQFEGMHSITWDGEREDLECWLYGSGNAAPKGFIFEVVIRSGRLTTVRVKPLGQDGRELATVIRINEAGVQAVSPYREALGAQPADWITASVPPDEPTRPGTREQRVALIREATGRAAAKGASVGDPVDELDQIARERTLDPELLAFIRDTLATDPRVLDAYPNAKAAVAVRATEGVTPKNTDPIDQLIAIGRSEGALLAPRESELRERIQAIGAALNETGGMESMRQAHAAVRKALGAARARELEVSWDGIGDWLG